MENKIILNVLIACEESQAECLAFRQLGHNAYSCDIQPCRPKGHPEWHIQGDVTALLDGCHDFVTQYGSQHHVSSWDLIICHPPCTYLSKVGSLHLYNNPDKWVITNKGILFVNGERYDSMVQGRNFFFRCLDAPANYVAVENPIPMKIAALPRPDCYVCPSWFGVKYTKKTLYWLKNLPPIMAEIDYPSPRCYVTASRGKYRSRTFPQLANAIAKQWSEYIINEIQQGQYEPHGIF